MTNLPAKIVKDPSYMTVIVDKLKRSVAIEDMRTKDCAEVFLKIHFRYHGFPKHVTSDRGSNRIGDFLEGITLINRNYSAFIYGIYQQTDGDIERMN